MSTAPSTVLRVREDLLVKDERGEASAEPAASSVTFTRRVSVAGFKRLCRVQIECGLGEAPRMTLDFGETANGGRVPPLTFDQWSAMREAIADMWGALSVRCVCGHAFRVHANRSPHGCTAEASPRSACVCAVFVATEPLMDPDP